MKIDDAAGQRWTVARRFLPWQRVVQPMRMADLEYRPYRVVPRVSGNGVRERTRRRRAERQAKPISGGGRWRWLYRLPLYLVVAGIAWLVEGVVSTLQVITLLVMTLTAAVELLVQLVIGAMLWCLRGIGLAKARVDVTANYRGTDEGFASITVLRIPGHGAAKGLVDAIATQRRDATGPFDPACPRTAALLAQHSVTVGSHATAWPAPENPATWSSHPV